MGCAHSVEKEAAVQRCRERRRLMKQLLRCRAELAAAHMAYLQSLRNTGATLRQFIEVDLVIPPAAPLLSPSLPPPPPPPLSPPRVSHEVRKAGVEEECIVEDLIDIGEDDDDDDCCTPPPPPLRGSPWDFWDPFAPPVSSSSSSAPQRKDNGGSSAEIVAEEENWADTNTEFGEEEEAKWEEEVTAGDKNVVIGLMRDASPIRELMDDNSSAASWVTKDTDMAVVVWRSRKTLAGIVRELDDYFLKAAAGGKDLALVLESNYGHRLHWNFEEIKGKSSKSAKVFHALSWSWSSRSLQYCRDASTLNSTNACMPGGLCTTLEKIYSEEQRLYKEVKDEELAKFQHHRKTMWLQKLEAKDHEGRNTEKTRSDIEELRSRIISLEDSINEACLSISKLRDEELWPQLVELSSGLVQMWRSMYECHQVQNHVAQQVNLLENHPGTEPTTESHRLATAQLETEATSWYTSFCNLLISQREYIRILNHWVRLTDCLPDSRLLGSTSGIHGLCEEWQCALERLPDKVAAEAIKSFVSVVHSIVMQQNEEHSLQKKYNRLESRLQKEVASLTELEKCIDNTVGNSDQVLGSNHRKLASKHEKMKAFKKRVDEERAKYLNSVHVSHAMALNQLKTSLPNVFQALMGFAGVCVQVFEGLRSEEATASQSGSVLPF